MDWVQVGVCKGGMGTYLHADDGVDEEQHGDEKTHIGQCLERLDERPQQYAYGVTLPQ